MLPADICNRVSECFSCLCIDCGKPHVVLNVVFRPVAEAVPLGWEPTEMRDFISGLTTGCPDNKCFVSRAEKRGRTFAGRGTAP